MENVHAGSCVYSVIVQYIRRPFSYTRGNFNWSLVEGGGFDATLKKPNPVKAFDEIKGVSWSPKEST